MRRPARLSAAIATVAVVALLGACESGGGDAGAKSTSSSSATKTPKATPTPTGPAELTAANFADRVVKALAGDTSYDFAMKIAAQGESIDAQGSAATAGGKQSLAMTMNMGDQGTIEMRLVDGKTYMSMGELTGGKFFAIDGSDPSNPLSASVGQMTDQTDPAQSIAQYKDAITSVTKSGAPEQLDGVAAQPYDVTVDTAKITGALQDQLKAAAASLPATITYKYWVGPDDVVRKLSISIMGAQTDMTFTHWGAGAPVTAPTADQLTDAPF